MLEDIRAVLPVVHTPFDESGAIDFETLHREVDFVFGHGAQGIVMALASEILRLTFAERSAMGRKLVEFAAGRGPVIIGAHGESTAQCLEHARAAEEAGAAAVMATPPLSGGWSEAQLFDHYAALVEETGLGVVVQDGSAYLGRPMSVAFQARLRNELGERVLFKPEGLPIGPQISALRDATQGQARIYEGMAGVYLVDTFRRGIAGTMPGSDCVDAVVAIWRALETGDEDAVYRLHPLLCSLMVLQSATLDTLLAIEKHLLVKRGVFRNTLRRKPYAYELDAETAEEAERLLARLLEAMAQPGA